MAKPDSGSGSIDKKSMIHVLYMRQWFIVNLSVLRNRIRILFGRRDPDPNLHWEYWSGSRRAKMNHKSEENSIFEVFSFVGWIEDFFYSLNVLCWSLEISKLQFLINKKKYIFVSAVNFFPIFGHQNPGSGYVSGSTLTKNAGSGSAFKPRRIQNTGTFHLFFCSAWCTRVTGSSAARTAPSASAARITWRGTPRRRTRSSLTAAAAA